jgi:hypothetical protein
MSLHKRRKKFTNTQKKKEVHQVTTGSEVTQIQGASLPNTHKSMLNTEGAGIEAGKRKIYQQIKTS